MANSVEVSGFIFSILDRIGTKSEGVEYYLQLLERYDSFDNMKKYHIEKKAEPWKVDVKLQPLSGCMVKIKGSILEENIEYISLDKIGP
ncbi:MAG: hypothetical protein NTX17_00210 [Candidatus Eisenbacteria bacterium]|nr:hypothetical protein [Candidatus Eisenbacteria bacterium]